MAETGSGTKRNGHASPAANGAVRRRTRGPGLTGGRRLEGIPLLQAGARVTLTNVSATLKTEGRFLPANLLAVIGALAGFAGQMAVRETLVETGRKREEEVFGVRRMPDGTVWFGGPQIDAPLVEGPMSLWGLASETARQLGAAILPDPALMSARQIALMRSRGYGRAEVDPRHRQTVETLAWLRAHWPKFRDQADRYCTEPVERIVFFGLMAQEALRLTRAAMPPETGVRILMESALAWSRLDPKRLSQ